MAEDGNNRFLRKVAIQFITRLLSYCTFKNSLQFLLVSVWIRCQIANYLLTPWSRVRLEKLTGFAANQEIPRIL